MIILDSYHFIFPLYGFFPVRLSVTFWTFGDPVPARVRCVDLRWHEHVTLQISAGFAPHEHIQNEPRDLHYVKETIYIYIYICFKNIVHTDK